MIDIRLILKIEKALGFNLNVMQSKYYSQMKSALGMVEKVDIQQLIW